MPLVGRQVGNAPNGDNTYETGFKISHCPKEDLRQSSPPPSLRTSL